MRAVLTLFRDAYTGLPAATWLLALAAFINRAGAMVLPFLQIYMGQRWGWSVQEAGAVISICGVGAVLGSLFGGTLCDRIGPVNVQILSLGVALVWFQLLGFVGDPYLFGAGMFVLGFVNDMFRPGNFAAAVESCAPHLRAKALALNRLALNAGWAIGPALGGLLSGIDWQWLFVVDGLTCGAAACYLFAFRHRLPRVAARIAGATAGPSPWSDGHYLWLCTLSTIALIVFMQYVFTESRYLHDELHVDKQQIGLLLSVNPIIIVTCEMAIVQGLRNRRPLPLVALGMLLVGGGLALLPLATHGLWMVIVSLLIVTIGEMLWSPFLGAYLQDIAPANSRGRYMGVYTATISASMIAAPYLGGLVYDDVSPDALWYACGIGGALTALAFLAAQRR